MDYMEEKMKNLRKISLVLVLALIVGTFGNVLPASAAKEVKSSWSFKTTSGKTVGVPNGIRHLQTAHLHTGSVIS